MILHRALVHGCVDPAHATCGRLEAATTSACFAAIRAWYTFVSDPNQFDIGCSRFFSMSEITSTQERFISSTHRPFSAALYVPCSTSTHSYLFLNRDLAWAAPNTL